MQAGNVAGGIHYHHAPAQERSVPTPRQLPADVHGFVNRTGELRHLNAILTGPDQDQLVVSVQLVAGTAGAGKTSLVLHWAHQVKHHFPDGQLFVNLRGYDPGEPVPAQHALGHFLRALGVPATEVPQDVDAAAALYRSVLADRRVLVLLDNAATAAQVRPLLPGSGNSVVVVTSRNRLAGLAIHEGARRLTLGTLPEPEAVALLRTVTAAFRPHDDPDRFVELARLCAHLPLALRIAAERAASHPHMGLDDLIAELRDESALWDALSAGADEETSAVHTVFAWSYRALSAPAARLFRLLGLHPGPEFSLHAATALAELPLGRTRQLLDDLVGAHLLEQTAPDRYQFHDLLRAYATDQAHAEDPPEQQAAAVRRVLDWYLHTADAAQSRIKPAEKHLPLSVPTAAVLPLDFADYDAAVDWSTLELGTLLRLTAAAAAAGLDTVAQHMAEILWNILPPSVPATHWFDTGRAGLGAARRTDDPGAQIRLLSNLGMALRRISALDESLDCHQRALALARESGKPLEEARSLNLIGLIHLSTRQLDPAAAHFEQASALFQELDEPRRAAMALSNLAGTRLEAGHLTEAARAAHEALAAHRALNNPESVGNILNDIAQIHCEQGEIEDARRSIDEALDIALSLRDHTLEGYWLLTLGGVQHTTGRYADALSSYQRSAMLHRRLGDRSREAIAWRGTGQTYTSLDRHPEAVSFHRQAAAVHRELGDTWQHALELDLLAVALHPADPSAARAHWAEALTTVSSYSDPRARTVRAQLERRLGRVD